MSKIRLFRLCRENKTQELSSYLADESTKGMVVDIFWKNAGIIKLAIELNSYLIIKLLLEYYENNVILKSKDEDEKDKSYAKLGKVLDEIISEFVFNKGKLSDEMLSVLSPYISLEDIEKMEVIETERKMDESFSEHEAAEAHDVGHLLGDTVE